MEDWTDIRERVIAGKVSKRAILRETGMHWLTLKKILTHSEPPGYRLRKARPKQKLGPYQERISQLCPSTKSVIWFFRFCGIVATALSLNLFSAWLESGSLRRKAERHRSLLRWATPTGAGNSDGWLERDRIRR